MKYFNYLMFAFIIMTFSVQLEARGLEKAIRKNIPKSFLGLNILREWQMDENKSTTKKGNGIISGKVTELNGVTPIVEIQLFAYNATTREGVACGWSDSSGNYIIKNLPTGSYKIKTLDWYGRVINIYYENTLYWDSAMVVLVADSDTIKNINFCLSKGGKIKGRVYENDGITGYREAALLVLDTIRGENISLSFSDSFGNYMVGSLYTGIYKLFIGCGREEMDTMYAFEWYSNKNNWTDADVINITAPDSVMGINVVLDRGGSISGQVYKEDGTTPISGVTLKQWMYVNGSSGWEYLYTDTTIGGGSYKLYGFRTGSYKVSASKEGYETRWYNDKPDSASADLVSATMPNNTPNIDFRLPIKAVEENRVTTYFELKAYPNPFINTTIIKYSLSYETKVSLKIYDMCGKLVKTLVDGIQNAGEQSITWNRQNDKKEKAPIGIYFCKINTGEKNITEKLILIR
ncbi:MAG: T9SS type A sorting domain-containing protein [bacterium]